MQLRTFVRGRGGFGVSIWKRWTAHVLPCLRHYARTLSFALPSNCFCLRAKKRAYVVTCRRCSITWNRNAGKSRSFPFVERKIVETYLQFRFPLSNFSLLFRHRSWSPTKNLRIADRDFFDTTEFRATRNLRSGYHGSHDD